MSLVSVFLPPFFLLSVHALPPSLPPLLTLAPFCPLASVVLQRQCPTFELRDRLHQRHRCNPHRRGPIRLPRQPHRYLRRPHAHRRTQRPRLCPRPSPPLSPHHRHSTLDRHRFRQRHGAAIICRGLHTPDPPNGSIGAPKWLFVCRRARMVPSNLQRRRRTGGELHLECDPHHLGWGFQK